MYVITKQYAGQTYFWGANGFQTDTTFTRHFMDEAKAEEIKGKLDLLHYGNGWSAATVLKV